MKAKGVVSYLVVFAFFSWCAVSFRADIAQIRLEQVWAARYTMLFVVLLSLGNYALRVTRWWVYFRCLGHSLPFGFIGLTYLAGFAFTLSPGKLGEMMRGRYYQKVGVPLSNTAAAFFVERFMDLLAMLTLACLALAPSSTYESLVWGAVGGIAAILVVLAIAPWTRISEGVQRTTWISGSLQKILHGVFRTLLSAKALLHPLLLVGGFLIALMAWGAEGIGLMVIGSVVPGVVMDWAAATSIYSIAIIVGALSFLPGGLGGTEAVMTALLAAHGYSMSDAILLTFICRLLTLWLAVVIGWISIFFLRWKFKGEVTIYL